MATEERGFGQQGRDRSGRGSNNFDCFGSGRACHIRTDLDRACYHCSRPRTCHNCANTDRTRQICTKRPLAQHNCAERRRVRTCTNRNCADYNRTDCYRACSKCACIGAGAEEVAA
jgi:hypothetical protein